MDGSSDVTFAKVVEKSHGQPQESNMVFVLFSNKYWRDGAYKQINQFRKRDLLGGSINKELVLGCENRKI